ncbi:MAG: hypothetical protein WCB12_01740 [Bryobacteraceae bacterium]
MGFGSALRKIAGGRIPPNDLASVTASLISGFADGTIQLEIDRWDLIGLIQRELSRMEFPTSMWFRLSDSHLHVLNELIKKEPALITVSQLRSMIDTVEGAIDPLTPLNELGAAAQGLCDRERRVRRSGASDEELSSLCQCMKKSVELRLPFEARGFLLDIGLASSSLFRRASELARGVCHELLYVVKRESAERHTDMPDDAGAIPYLLDRIPAAIDNVFWDEGARLTVFENVVRAARNSHLHEAGVLRLVVSDREKNPFRPEDNA